MTCAARPRFGRPIRLCATALLACVLAGSAATARSAEGEIVPCYDAGRGIVTHTLADQCKGEIISHQRASALAAERRRQIRSTIEAEEDDPLTGRRRLVGTGTGFYIGRDGALLTNDHVINHCAMITATPDDGDKVAL